jgi:hypothetical protein
VADITVSVQGTPADLSSWLSRARRLEASGFDALLMGDHPGGWASPWPALGAAAAVTRTLRLGTYVVQAADRRRHADPSHGQPRQVDMSPVAEPLGTRRHFGH